jgi:hypothetical protein
MTNALSTPVSHDAYVIQINDRTAGLAVAVGQQFRFYASDAAFFTLEGRLFPDWTDIRAACRQLQPARSQAARSQAATPQAATSSALSADLNNHGGGVGTTGTNPLWLDAASAVTANLFPLPGRRRSRRNRLGGFVTRRHAA